MRRRRGRRRPAEAVEGRARERPPGAHWRAQCVLSLLSCAAGAQTSHEPTRRGAGRPGLTSYGRSAALLRDLRRTRQAHAAGLDDQSASSLLSPRPGHALTPSLAHTPPPPSLARPRSFAPAGSGTAPGPATSRPSRTRRRSSPRTSPRLAPPTTRSGAPRPTTSLSCSTRKQTTARPCRVGPRGSGRFPREVRRGARGRRSSRRAAGASATPRAKGRPAGSACTRAGYDTTSPAVHLRALLCRRIDRRPSGRRRAVCEDSVVIQSSAASQRRLAAHPGSASPTPLSSGGGGAFTHTRPAARSCAVRAGSAPSRPWSAAQAAPGRPA